MNWFKISQQDITQQYADLATSPGDIQITGSGVGETLNINGTNISAREMLNQIVSAIRPTLLANGVRQIDTSPISQANAQGLAISTQPGVIHVDIGKIFNLHKQALPPTAQFDGTQIDPDILTDLAKKILNSIQGEIAETSLHESWHSRQFGEAVQQNKPFSSVQESPADQFGKKMRKQHFPESFSQ